MVGKSWHQELEVALPIAFTVRKQREFAGTQLAFSFIFSIGAKQ